ncbi:flagellin [Candidatus Caldatribacterium sp.]|uniref:flagellin N-terminal helical domain-containing protein n=1 Tax=Candidatus Caldatribacterium sp. TaxID=2282143 RepID=UPI0029947F48|nr:flagellin [Candidatus Caldatribacterium sp.]MDW8082128.1 flagellin [Candidatus Calescibacterium sp.]
MGLRINQNITALNAHRNLVATDNALSKSLERLSSGLRINRAADDAAGLAISEKMRGQIKGLSQAIRNAQDAISLIQTAEGALNETHSILQRMRQLAVQASNDTLTPDDREQIQKEINQLIEELDRIGNTTEFNTKKLLNGQAGYSVTAQNGLATGGDVTVNGVLYTAGSGIALSDLEALVTRLTPGTNTRAGVYTVVITQNATRAQIGGVDAGDTTVNYGGTIVLNGVAINVVTGEDLDNVVLKINNVKNLTGVEAVVSGNSIVLTSINYGSSATINVSGANNLLVDLGLTSGSETVLSDAGTDIVGTINGQAAIGRAGTLTLVAPGNEADGLSITIDPAKLELETGASLQFSAVVDASGAVTLHIGANKDQTMTISIGDMRAQALGVNNISVLSQRNAEEAIATIDNAINIVSTERSKLGAYQNRLEHTIANLGVAKENLAAAESRIRDVDMAEEMMEFTRAQILLQAGTAMLAQANTIPQAVLQLLR